MILRHNSKFTIAATSLVLLDRCRKVGPGEADAEPYPPSDDLRQSYSHTQTGWGKDK